MKMLYVGRPAEGKYVINPYGRNALLGPDAQIYPNKERFLYALEQESKHRKITVEIDKRATDEETKEIVEIVKNSGIRIEQIIKDGHTFKKSEISRN